MANKLGERESTHSKPPTVPQLTDASAVLAAKACKTQHNNMVMQRKLLRQNICAHIGVGIDVSGFDCIREFDNKVTKTKLKNK